MARVGFLPQPGEFAPWTEVRALRAKRVWMKIDRVIITDWMLDRIEVLAKLETGEMDSGTGNSVTDWPPFICP